MAKLWITYSWKDNENNDVDFIAQQLQACGLTVKLDRWNIVAGKRLWEQIENFITTLSESDAWLLIATGNSLQSEACKEEFAYALDRTLRARDSNFPVIALFLGPVDDDLIPTAVKARLFVSITDPDWKERIVSAAERRGPHIAPLNIEPYIVKIHKTQSARKAIAIEIRPRAGVWAPFFVAIPMSEKTIVEPNIMVGPRDVPTASGMLINTGESQSSDGAWWVMAAGNEATPTRSYYVWCNNLPSRIAFGVNGRQPQFQFVIK